MTDSKKKLTREEIAKIEIGNTTVSKPVKFLFTFFFLFLIGGYCLIQCIWNPPHNQIKAMPKQSTLQQAFKQFETDLEDASLLRSILLEPVQNAIFTAFRTGNEKIIVGKDGWLFFSGDFEYLDNPGFLAPDTIRKRERKAAVTANPLPAILAFQKELEKRNIRLILLPMPVKPMIYGDKLGADSSKPLQNPSYESFRKTLAENGIAVIDVADDLLKMRADNCESYLKTDTHWTPDAMRAIARKIAAQIDPEATPAAEELQKQQITAAGDIAYMFRFSEIEQHVEQETVAITPYDTQPDRNADVLLLGDSFTNIYSVADMRWGSNAGFAEMLAYYLGRPIDVIARNDAGAHATRDALANEYRHGRDRLAGKKTVIWEFAIRELANGDWSPASFELVEHESSFLSIKTEKKVTATVLNMSSVPKPFAAPYKDHIMTLYLGDIGENGDQVLVYVVSMRDNVLQPVTKLHIGDTIEITLSPWESAEETYGNWNRSEFTDEELLLEEPCFGTLCGI